MFLPAKQKPSQRLEKRGKFKFMRTYVFVKLEFFFFLRGKGLSYPFRKIC